MYMHVYIYMYIYMYIYTHICIYRCSCLFYHAPFSLIQADRVLVDAPCSGIGAWRRNPDARWGRAGTGLDELIPLQASLNRVEIVAAVLVLVLALALVLVLALALVLVLVLVLVARGGVSRTRAGVAPGWGSTSSSRCRRV